MPEDQSTRKLFHAEPGDAPPGSLSDYIAKHLKERGENPTIEDSSLSARHESYFDLPAEEAASNEEGAPPQVGYILHHLDSQLINDHLERYVPSPATRFHMTRERIAHELEALDAELNQYHKLGGKEYQGRIEALEHRKAMLLEKLSRLDEKLNDINPFRGMVNKFNNFAFQRGGGSSVSQKRQNPWRFIPNRQSRLTQEVADMNHELETLQHILEEQLHDPNFSSLQMGRLVNQYDAQLRQAERLMEELKSQKGILAVFSARIQQFFRKK